MAYIVDTVCAQSDKLKEQLLEKQTRKVTVCKPSTELETCVASASAKLVDFKVEFGIDKDGNIILADEISPDSCRFWDATTNEKLDKDRFRQDLGSVKVAYEEVLRRILS